MRMMGRFAILFLAATWLQATAVAGPVQLGVGAHYWRAVEDLDSDLNSDGIGWQAIVRLSPARLLHLQAELEFLPKEIFGLDDQILAPQVHVILGSTLYAALGIGTYYVDGDFAKDPFYNVRAGLDLEFFAAIHLDIHANYRFDEWNTIKTLEDNVDSDTITLGVAIRVEL